MTVAVSVLIGAIVGVLLTFATMTPTKKPVTPEAPAVPLRPEPNRYDIPNSWGQSLRVYRLTIRGTNYLINNKGGIIKE